MWIVFISVLRTAYRASVLMLSFEFRGHQRRHEGSGLGPGCAKCRGRHSQPWSRNSWDPAPRVWCGGGNASGHVILQFTVKYLPITSPDWTLRTLRPRHPRCPSEQRSMRLRFRGMAGQVLRVRAGGRRQRKDDGSSSHPLWFGKSRVLVDAVAWASAASAGAGAGGAAAAGAAAPAHRNNKHDLWKQPLHCFQLQMITSITSQYSLEINHYFQILPDTSIFKSLLHHYSESTVHYFHYFLYFWK